MNGELHVAVAPPSTWHSKLVAPPEPVNVNVGVVSLVAAPGPSVMVVLGVLVSTLKVCVAGVPSTLPAASIARTSNV